MGFPESPPSYENRTGHLVKQVGLRGPLNPGSEEIGVFRATKLPKGRSPGRRSAPPRRVLRNEGPLRAEVMEFKTDLNTKVPITSLGFRHEAPGNGLAFKEPIETRMDTPTSMTFGLLAVSNQRQLGS